MIDFISIHVSESSRYCSRGVTRPRIKKRLDELSKDLNVLPIAMQESAHTLLRRAALDLQDHLDTYEDTSSCALQEELSLGLSALDRLTRELCDAPGSAQDMRASWNESRSRFLFSIDPCSHLEDDSSGSTALGQSARQAADQALSTTATVKGVVQNHIKTLGAGRETSHDRILLDRVVGPLQTGGVSQNKKKDNKDVEILRLKISRECEIQESLRSQRIAQNDPWDHFVKFTLESSLPDDDGKRSSDTSPVQISTGMSRRLREFLNHDGPKGGCCVYLDNELYGKYRSNAFCSCHFNPDEWTYHPLKDVTRLFSGDAIWLRPERVTFHKDITGRFASSIMGHFAVYLSDGRFLLITGNRGTLIMSDFEAMKKEYQPRHVYKLIPKEGTVWV